MSSNCSINCCSSPEITSSNVSVSNMNGVASNDASGNRVRTTVPETKKDKKYWERRRRNNEAARRSREKRRQNDMVMDKRILELSQRNKQLERELFQLKMNFGLGNNNLDTIDLDDPSGNLLSSITIHESVNNNNNNNNCINNNNNNNNSAEPINGMVFPVFTAFQPDTTETIESKPNTESLNISGITNKLNDNPKLSTNSTNKYQANLISLGNIPFLSNLIKSPNFNDDITSKATLLLPSLVPKTPTKSLEPNSCSLSNTALPQIDGLTFNSPPDLTNGCKNLSNNSDKTKLSTNSNPLKMELQDILDLSLKQESTDCFFMNREDSPPNLFSRQISTTKQFNNANKDVVTHNSSDNQSIDESMTNSFLSGILSTNSKDRLSVCMKRKSVINNRLNHNKTRRCNSINDTQNNSEFQNTSICHFNEFRNHLNLKTRLHIRREVSGIVINENRKLRKDIDCLTTEIKLLKTAMLECAKLSVTNSLSKHNSTEIDQQSVDNLPDENRPIFVQFTPIN